MTPRHRVGSPEAGGGARSPTREGRPSIDPRTVAGVVALCPVAVVTGYRIAHNAPGTLPAWLVDVGAAVRPVAVLGPALAALALATRPASTLERAGLALVGGFGALAIGPSAAWHPAAAGLVIGGGLAVCGALRRGEGTVSRGRRAVLATLVGGGVVASLAGAAGIAPTTLRPVGSALALVGVGLAPLAVEYDATGLTAGILAAGVTVGVASTVPYVAGAVLLVGGGVVAAPLALVAVAVGGGLAALAAALRAGRPGAGAGAALLLAAGVPGDLPRAVGVIVALSLLVTAAAERPNGRAEGARVHGGEPA